MTKGKIYVLFFELIFHYSNMQKIIPLTYKVKLWKGCLSEEIIKKYSNPKYFKERLEEEFKLSEHLKDPIKIFVKKCSSKDVSLEEEVEIDDFNGKTFIFTKFKYWDKVAENDNWKVCHEWEIVQIMANQGSLLTDFYCGFDFCVRPDSKYLIIEWTITTIQKSNEQMRAQIYHMLKFDLYPQGNTEEHEPEYSVKFKFEEQEVKNIQKKVKWLELVTEIIQDSELDQAESWKRKKNIPLKVIIWGGMNDAIYNTFANVVSKIPWVESIKKRAIIKQWKSTLRSEYSSDWLLLSLKDAFLYSDESIDYQKFKQETYKYIFPNMEFDN